MNTARLRMPRAYKYRALSAGIPAVVHSRMCTGTSMGHVRTCMHVGMSRTGMRAGGSEAILGCKTCSSVRRMHARCAGRSQQCPQCGEMLEQVQRKTAKTQPAARSQHAAAASNSQRLQPAPSTQQHPAPNTQHQPPSTQPAGRQAASSSSSSQQHAGMVTSASRIPKKGA